MKAHKEIQKACNSFKKLTEVIEKNATVSAEAKSILERFAYVIETIKEQSNDMS